MQKVYMYITFVLAGVGLSRFLQAAGVPREPVGGLFLLFILGYGGYKLISAVIRGIIKLTK